MKKKLWIAAAAVLSAALLFSGYQVGSYLLAGQKAGQQFSNIAAQVVDSAPDKPSGGAQAAGKSAPSTPTWTVYDQYGKLFQQNPDMVGWIRLDGTAISYPVMQTPNTPDFYLTHGFDKQPSIYGVPFVDAACSLDPQSDNITIFSHHMKNGTMFAALENYKSEAFGRAHPLIHFDTKFGFGTYQVIAVFHTTPARFLYNAFVSAPNAAAFDDYVGRCKSLEYYNTGTSASYGDKLLTLSTCEYSEADSRLVVVAKKIS